MLCALEGQTTEPAFRCQLAGKVGRSGAPSLATATTGLNCGAATSLNPTESGRHGYHFSSGPFASGGLMELSKRQAEVVECVARGLPNKQIAAKLDLSVRTVENHIREAASHIPGSGAPRYRLMLFFLNIDFSQEKL